MYIPPTLEAVVSYSDALFVKMLKPGKRQRKALEAATRQQDACIH